MEKLEAAEGVGGTSANRTAFEAYSEALFDVMCKKSHQWRETQQVVWNGQKRKEKTMI